MEKSSWEKTKVTTLWQYWKKSIHFDFHLPIVSCCGKIHYWENARFKSQPPWELRRVVVYDQHKWWLMVNSLKWILVSSYFFVSWLKLYFSTIWKLEFPIIHNVNLFWNWHITNCDRYRSVTKSICCKIHWKLY